MKVKKPNVINLNVKKKIFSRLCGLDCFVFSSLKIEIVNISWLWFNRSNVSIMSSKCFLAHAILSAMFSYAYGMSTTH